MNVHKEYMQTVKVIEPVPEFVLSKKRVAAYARVSVETELTNHSITAQIDYYRNLIKNRPDWEFAGIYADEGLTGTKAGRPGFQNMLKDCDDGKIDLIIAKSLSRFARNTVDLLETIRHLKALGIGVYFEKENVNTLSGSGELLITIMASFAQEEARSTSENNRWTVQKRFQEGKVNNFFLYGYRWDGKEFHIVPEQAAVVKEIYSSYLAGRTPDQIANELRKRNVPSTKGKAFTYSLVWSILRLEKYTGNSLLNKVFCEDFLTKKYIKNEGQKVMYFAEGTHPQIIDQKTYDAVQEEIRRRQELGYLANQSLHFSCFTGKVFCSQCGHTYRRRMSGMKHRTNRQYLWKCGNKITGGASFCSGQNVQEQKLYELTSDVLGKENFTEEDFNAVISRIEVSNPCILTFFKKDGTEEMRRWICTTPNTRYREVYNGTDSKSDSTDKGDVLIKADRS